MLYMVGFHGLISDILNKGRLKDHLLVFSRQINIAKWSEHIILLTKNHTLGHKSNTNHSSYLNLHSIISNLWKFTQPKGTSNNQQQHGDSVAKSLVLAQSAQHRGPNHGRSCGRLRSFGAAPERSLESSGLARLSSEVVDWALALGAESSPGRPARKSEVIEPS